MRFISKRSEDRIPTSFTNWVDDPVNRVSEKIGNPEVTGTELWNTLRGSTKKKLREALLEDQGYICCYCGKRIKDDDNTRIEHLKPKSNHKHLTFDYANLLASCQGATKNVIHIVQAGELLADIAEQYGVNEAYLEEVWVQADELELFRKKYDIENLQAGDRLVIFPEIGEQQHCDNKKGNDEIALTPLQKNCVHYFAYDQAGKVILNEANKTTVISLGLNDNTYLNRLRKKTLDEASYLKTLLIRDFGHSKSEFNQKRLALIQKLDAISVQRPKLRPLVFVIIWSLNN